MDAHIRVLGIAPYEGMKILMSNLASEYPQIDLTLFVGDMEQGLEIARNAFHGNYDVVISRGGTAKMLQQHLSLPVIEIEISMYDILCALKLADGLPGKTAMVSFANMTGNAQQLCELLGYDIGIYTIDTPDTVEATLHRLQSNQYESILCDMIANTTSKRLGLNSILITSGIDSIRRAFEQVLLLCNSQNHLREENLFFRELIQGQISQTVVFDEDDHLFFSTPEDLSPELLDLLRRELPESRREPERRITRNFGGMLYAMQARQIPSGNSLYIVFFFAARKTPLSLNQSGIQFSTRPEAESAFYSSIFSFAGTISDFQEKITKINQSNAPIMVTGEDGTGKEPIVSVLYMRSPLRNNPLVSINCNLLNEKSWAFLLEHHNSPLFDEGSTLYFASIDVLTTDRRQQLLSTLQDMGVCRRNRVTFSCVCQPGEYMSAIGSTFMDKLCCLSLHLPPLRQMAERIPSLVNLSLSHLNVDMLRKVVGAEPEAMALLQSFPWPHNYSQFRRVIGQLAVTATGQIIAVEDVRQILRQERHVGAFSPRAENSAVPLNLNRTLDEISQDVARRVVEETGGNQTTAAKRLGISRTTLWRLLQK